MTLRIAALTVLLWAGRAAVGQPAPPPPPAPAAGEPAAPTIGVAVDTGGGAAAGARAVTIVGYGADAQPATAVSLGVALSPVEGALREQLKLPRGVGLVVTGVDAGGPGQAAGVKTHDVLEKLDDQLAINVEQVAALVRARKAGDVVTLSVVRQGQRQAVKVTLADRPASAAGADARVTVTGDFVEFINDRLIAAPHPVWVRQVAGDGTTQWSDDAHQVTVERAGDAVKTVTVVDRKTGKTVVTIDGDPAASPAALKDLPELRAKVERAVEAARRPAALHVAFADGARFVDRVGGGGGGVARGKVVTWQDDRHVLVVRLSPDGKRAAYLLALSRKDGRTVFDGPVATAEQRRGVPPEVAEQFEVIAGHPEVGKEFGAPTTDPKR